MILVFAGVQADLPDAAEQRLPQSAEGALRHCIEDLLRTLGPRLAVGAAATGSDIIIAEAALSAGVPVRIVLPFAREAFEETSLHARDPSWRQRFTALLDVTGPAVTGGLDAADPRVFEQHNQVLLELATEWAEPSEPVLALAIRPPARATHSTTDDFAERCLRMGVPLLDVDPLDVDLSDAARLDASLPNGVRQAAATHAPCPAPHAPGAVPAPAPGGGESFPGPLG